jgi:hypothetical protein
MFRSKYLIASAILASAVSTAAFGAVANILPTDSFTAIPNANGTNVFIYSGYYYSFETTESFLKYDLSSLAAPQGQQLVINSVTMTANYSASTFGDPFTQSLYPVVDDSWTGGAIAWASRPTAGATAVASDTRPAAWSNVTMFNSTAGFVSLVQQEADGDGTLSVMFKAIDLGTPPTPETVGGANQHAEYYPFSSGATAPRLDIDYSYAPVPEPASFGLIGTSLMFMLTRRRSRSEV